MPNIFSTFKGMNIIGQGGKIILFMLPSLVAAIWLQNRHPQLVALPRLFIVFIPLGYLMLGLGFMFWLCAVVQLLVGFTHGSLITKGAYGVVRNPIYSSVTCFILPAVTLLTQTWVYLPVSAFLAVGVSLFIAKEEEILSAAFGQEYLNYKTRVPRLIPFTKPSTQKA